MDRVVVAKGDEEIDQLLDRLEVFKIQGRDKRGRAILRVVGKFFPARVLSGAGGEAALKGYLERRIFPELDGKSFVVVYLHTRVQRSDNFPGLGALRSLCEELPSAVREGLHALYFVHPGLQARLFLGTLGRFFFKSELYEKLKYVSRLEFLWGDMRRGEMEIPEFVYDHDEDLERRPLMDYGLESGLHGVYDAPGMDSAASMHALRCFS